jgi:hypothetical protein
MNALASSFLYEGVTQMYNSKTPTNINKKKYLNWKSCLDDLSMLNMEFLGEMEMIGFYCTEDMYCKYGGRAAGGSQSPYF